MANRHLLRSIAMQTLFEWDFNSKSDFDMEEILERNVKEFAPGIEDKEFAQKLITGVLEQRKKIDAIIEKTAPEWPIKQIAVVDRNVLRIGLYELLFGTRKEVPPRVAINEAIELAKTFGGEASGKFVNGVLGTVYREMGEPDKDIVPKEKKDLKDLPLEKLGGAVVYRKENNEVFFAFVHDVFGYWTLSKGRLEGDENSETGTIREIKEELGVDIKLEGELGTNRYIASHPEKGPIQKSVTYFLGKTESKDLKLGTSGGLDDARWFRADEVGHLEIYEDLKPILQKAVDKIKASV